MQKIHLIGNLTRDPETRTTQSGVSVCSFSVAVSRRFPVNGEKVTDFFNVNAWRGLAETCQKFLSKGKKVAVVGELQPRTYAAKDGTTRVSLDVSADEVEFLSPKGESAQQTYQGAPTAGLEGFESIPESDLPF